MSIAATFLGGARGRLLPTSLPFRFFTTAVIFHVGAWIMLLIGADDVAGYEGGLGQPLAALHLLTLGVLAMTAMGAAFQLLPVATRQILAAGALAGLAAAGFHLRLIAWVLKKRMRKRLDLSFRVMQAAWVLLPVGLVLGLMSAAGLDYPGGVTLFGFVVLAGWLLTMLTGVLQRIMPFLASMHVAKVASKPPLVSELTASLPLQIHAACHGGALVLVAAGICFDLTIAIQAGAARGVAGALAFAWFAGKIIQRLWQTPAES